MPTRRPDDDYDDPDDRPRRRDPDDDDRPRRRRRDDDAPPPKSGGAGRTLLILLLVAGGLVVICCGGCMGLGLYFVRKQVTIVDATRTRSAQGGTATVSVNVLIGGDNPGGFFKGDFNFVFQSGSRKTVHHRGLRAFGPGRGPAEYRETFMTPELAGETGPVTFWVEGGSGFRVSPEYTIP